MTDCEKLIEENKKLKINIKKMSDTIDELQKAVQKPFNVHHFKYNELDKRIHEQTMEKVKYKNKCEELEKKNLNLIKTIESLKKQNECMSNTIKSENNHTIKSENRRIKLLETEKANLIEDLTEYVRLYQDLKRVKYNDLE